MRMSTGLLKLFALLLAGLALVPAGQAGELSRGALLAASCEGCHGTGGRSPGAIPAIAGKSAQYLQETLESFRSGERPSTVMGRHVTGYSEDEIRQIAEYFSQQK